MMSPVAMEFAGMLATVGMFFCLWHFWRYDNFRCLVPNRANAFLCIMCWTIVVALGCLVSYTWMQAYVLYDVYYIQLQGVTMPTPAQLWPENLSTMWRQSLYVLTIGWVCMHAVHLEEFLYWAYLIDSIRKPSSRPVTWFRSVYCKLWIGGSIACGALVGGAAAIETADVQRMRAWIFLIGGSVSTLLAIASTVLSLSLPSFVRAVHSSGASSEVVSRLAFYQELHFFRTVCRWVFGVCAIIQAADGITAAQRLNRLDFWPDFLTIASLLSIFWALTISVIVLLPRNINSEAQPTQAKQAMRQFNPHRESRVPQIAPVPFSKRVHTKKRALAGDAKAFEGDIENLENASDESSDSISKSVSPMTPATPGPPEYTESAFGTQPARAVGRTGSTGRVRIRNRNNLHVLGERLNIDAQQLKDLIEEDQVGAAGEDMEMPVLNKQRSGRNVPTMGQGELGAIAEIAMEPISVNGSATAPVPILIRGREEKQGVRHVERAYGHSKSQSPFDDKAAAGPVIRVHSPNHEDANVNTPKNVHHVSRSSSPSFSRHLSTGTDSVDSLPYAQPCTMIEPQPSLHSLSTSPDADIGGAEGSIGSLGAISAGAERERTVSGLSQASRKKSTTGNKDREHPFSASAVDRRARLQARDEGAMGERDVGQANRDLAKFLDKGPGGPRAAQ